MGCCGGGGGVPPPDPNEAKLTALELKNTLATSELNEQMMPFILEELGFNKVPLGELTDEELEAQIDEQFGAQTPQTTGRYNELITDRGGSRSREQIKADILADHERGYRLERIEDPEADARQAVRGQIEDAANERTLKALQGELDVDPSVTKDIDRGRAELEEKLYRTLGPGAEGSTAWNRAVAEYDRQANALKYSIRHGEMTSADAVATNRQNIATRNQNQMFNQMQGTATPFVSAANLATQGAGRHQRGRLETARINTSRDNARAAMIGSAISGGMAAGGSVMGAKIMAKK